MVLLCDNTDLSGETLSCVKNLWTFSFLNPFFKYIIKKYIYSMLLSKQYMLLIPNMWFGISSARIQFFPINVKVEI